MAAGVFRSVEVGGVSRALADTLLGGALTRPAAATGTGTDSAAYLSVVFSTLINGIVNRAPPAAPERAEPPPPPGEPGTAARTESW
jgi:hypothetical protein